MAPAPAYDGTPNWSEVLRVSRWRRVSNATFSALTILALLAVVAPAVWLVGGVVARALPTWQWSVLTTTTRGLEGGLLGAIAGTAALVLGVLVLAGTLGVLTGLHLSEFTRSGRGAVLRGGYEVLAGMPSIVLGYVGYVALVVGFHWGFSLGAGVIVLSVMVIPYIAKATEAALGSVPSSYREAAEALGLPAGYSLRRIVVRAALPGIATGLIVAVAIAVGETAPLLYTAGWSDGLPSPHVTHSPVGYLTYPVWTFYNQPFPSAHALAYDAALLLVVIVLGLIALARGLVWALQRHVR